MIAPSDMYWSETDLKIGENEKTAGIHVAGNYGWFLERGWMLGVQTNLGVYADQFNMDQSWGYKENSFDISIAPMTRYYFTVDKKHRFKPFLFAGMPIVYGSHEMNYTNQATTDYKNESVELRSTFGLEAGYFGKAGNIEMHISNMGFFLQLNKFIQPTKL